MSGSQFSHHNNTPLMFARQFKKSTRPSDSPNARGHSPTETLYTVNKYTLEFEQHTIAYVLSPVYFGSSFEPEFYEASGSEKPRRRFHKISFAGQEELPRVVLERIADISAMFFRVIMSSGERSFNVTNCGRFDGFLAEREQFDRAVNKAKSNQRLGYNYKNYLVLPLPFDLGKQPLASHGTVVDIASGVLMAWAHIEQVWGAFVAGNWQPELKELVFHAGNNYALLSPPFRLGSLTLEQYVRLVAECSFRIPKSNSPDEFCKWMFSDSVAKAMARKPLFELLGDDSLLQQFKMDQREKSYYMCPLQSAEGASPDSLLLLAYRLPTLRELPEFNDVNSVSLKREELLQFARNLLGQSVLPSALEFLPVSSLRPMPFEIASYEFYHRSLSFLSTFERYAIVTELSEALGLSFARPFDLYCALQNEGADADYNYQNMETIGDSVLKFVVSLHLFTTLPVPEGELTVRKVRIIQNTTLAAAGAAKGLNFGVRLKKVKNQFFIPPNFSLDESEVLRREEELKAEYKKGKDLNKEQFWAGKNEKEIVSKINLVHEVSADTVADVVEALIGAAFVKESRVDAGLHVMHKFGVLGDFDFGAYEAAFRSSVAIDFATMEQALGRRDAITQRSGNGFLFRLLVADSSLGHEFANPYWKAQAFDLQSEQFQRLEFLGDAVLEVYLVANLNRLLELMGAEASPLIFTNAKSWLLSCFQLCRFAAMFGLHNSVVSGSSPKESAMRAFADKFDESAPVQPESAPIAQKDSTLEDLFEAVVGAAFLDGFWEAVHAMLDARLIGFLVYFAKWHSAICFDCKGSVLKKLASLGKRGAFRETFKDRSVVCGLYVAPEGVQGAETLFVEGEPCADRQMAENSCVAKAMHKLSNDS